MIVHPHEATPNGIGTLVLHFLHSFAAQYRAIGPLSVSVRSTRIPALEIIFRGRNAARRMNDGFDWPHFRNLTIRGGRLWAAFGHLSRLTFGQLPRSGDRQIRGHIRSAKFLLRALAEKSSLQYPENRRYDAARIAAVEANCSEEFTGYDRVVDLTAVRLLPTNGCCLWFANLNSL